MKSFLDTIDSDWKETISNTYEKHVDKLIYKDGDISIVFDRDTLTTDILKNSDDLL